MNSLEWKIRANKQILSGCKSAPNGLQLAMVDFFQAAPVNWAYAFTGTFAKPIKQKYKVEGHCREFNNCLNSRCGFPNWRRKFKHDSTERLPMLSVIEGDGYFVHYHCHFLLALPPDMNKFTFASNILSAWKGIKGNSILFNDLQPIYNLKGWVEYITKEFKTTNNTEAVNWQATHLYREITH